MGRKVGARDGRWEREAEGGSETRKVERKGELGSEAHEAQVERKLGGAHEKVGRDVGSSVNVNHAYGRRITNLVFSHFNARTSFAFVV